MRLKAANLISFSCVTISKFLPLLKHLNILRITLCSVSMCVFLFQCFGDKAQGRWYDTPLPVERAKMSKSITGQIRFCESRRGEASFSSSERFFCCCWQSEFVLERNAAELALLLLCIQPLIARQRSKLHFAAEFPPRASHLHKRIFTRALIPTHTRETKFWIAALQEWGQRKCRLCHLLGKSPLSLWKIVNIWCEKYFDKKIGNMLFSLAVTLYLA